MELSILDVENPTDFEDWKIERKVLIIYDKPYFDLLEGVEEILEDLPTDREVLIVCAKEYSSVMVPEMLSEALPDVGYLEGGMKAWSEHMGMGKVGDLTNGCKLYQFVHLGKGCLSYMVISNGEAAVIDATRMIDIFTNFAMEKGATYWLPPKDVDEPFFGYRPLND